MTERLLDARSEHLRRELAPQVLGGVTRRFHDFAAAEDAVQEAPLAAALQWPRDGGLLVWLRHPPGFNPPFRHSTSDGGGWSKPDLESRGPGQEHSAILRHSTSRLAGGVEHLAEATLSSRSTVGSGQEVITAGWCSAHTFTKDNAGGCLSPWPWWAKNLNRWGLIPLTVRKLRCHPAPASYGSPHSDLN